MKLYFARHGHTDATANSPINPVSGEIDEPLNSEGLLQANDLAEQLKDVHFDAIISSPFKRAYQTAEIVNKYHDIAIEVSPIWRERETGAYLEVEAWKNLFDFDKNYTLEKGEDMREFFARIYSALDELKRKYANKTVLVVSHAGVQMALNAYINKLPLVGNVIVKPMENCEYRIYELAS